jgi:uncharacterized protein YbjQ (UPF0145 family)
MNEFQQQLMGVAVVAIVLGFLVGAVFGLPFVTGVIGRRRHRRSLAARRETLSGMLLTDLRSFPGGVDSAKTPELVVTQAVYCADGFASFVSHLKKVVGGNLGFYQELTSRTREEATVRLLELARAAGFDAVCNLRIDWTDIAGTGSPENRKKGAMVSLMASGTAYRRTTGG